MINKETQVLQTKLDKQHHIKKNELKTYKNKVLVDNKRLAPRIDDKAIATKI